MFTASLNLEALQQAVNRVCAAADCEQTVPIARGLEAPYCSDACQARAEKAEEKKKASSAGIERS